MGNYLKLDMNAQFHHYLIADQFSGNFRGFGGLGIEYVYRSGKEDTSQIPSLPRATSRPQAPDPANRGLPGDPALAVAREPRSLERPVPHFVLILAALPERRPHGRSVVSPREEVYSGVVR